MKIAMIREGEIVVDEIPAPQVDAGMVLVKVNFSCISAGTELQGIQNSNNSPLWKRALENPEKALEVAKKLHTKGLAFTRNLVESKLAGSEAGRPTGYSAMGTIQAIGEGITDLQVGQRVACAGSQYAFHAEYIAVPRNLVVAVPDDVDSSAAATVTPGAIALQGVRRAHPTLGETFVVIGLGILGQLTVQMLKANGCRVIGIDLDRNRVEQTLASGMDVGIHPETGDALEQTARLTDGHGADGVIITAATKSDEVISTAFKLCRRKGRVVLVGDVGLNLNRADFYEKEIDFLISTSYGPGRYDRRYEEDGLDYPIAYVRWTENRNMVEYLRLIADGRIQIEPLISQKFMIDDAPAAFASFTADTTDQRPLIVLIEYDAESVIRHTIINPHASPLQKQQVSLMLVGAGNFTRNVHLPNLRLLSSRYYLHTIVSRSGETGGKVARQYQFKQASTDFDAVIKQSEVDAVLIATRHDRHAPMLMDALQQGKHVFVEKPTVINEDQLATLREYVSQGMSNLLMTGYNRRFSPHVQYILERTGNSREPMIINYRMNAGQLPSDHWTYGSQGGGRNIGEACHIYDLFVLLTASKATSISAKAIESRDDYYQSRDNFVATIRFENGSLCTLTYTSLGSADYPKEMMEIFTGGRVISMMDYKSTEVVGHNPGKFQTPAQEKGNKEILERFARAIIEGGTSPISIEDQLEVMRITFEVERLLAAGT